MQHYLPLVVALSRHRHSIGTKKHFILGTFAGQKVVEETLKLVRIEVGSASDQIVSNLAISAEDALKKIRSVSPLSGLSATYPVRYFRRFSSVITLSYVVFQWSYLNEGAKVSLHLTVLCGTAPKFRIAQWLCSAQFFRLFCYIILH